MKILVIDGQGGKMGGVLVEQIKQNLPQHELIAVGTNSVATSAMLKAGADAGATGENPVIVNAADADVIVGPIGVLVADALLGEITPAMAQAVAKSRAQKIILPVNKCKITVVGAKEETLGGYVRLAVEEIKALRG